MYVMYKLLAEDADGLYRGNASSGRRYSGDRLPSTSNSCALTCEKRGGERRFESDREIWCSGV